MLQGNALEVKGRLGYFNSLNITCDTFEVPGNQINQCHVPFPKLKEQRSEKKYLLGWRKVKLELQLYVSDAN